MSFLTTLSRELFDVRSQESPGHVVFFKLFELFIVGATINYAWSWGLYILRISDVVLPLGIANYIDVSLFFQNGSSLAVAGLITLFCMLGFFRVTKYAYMAAFLLLHLQFSTRFTLGEIPHSSNVVGMTLLGFSLATLFFDEPRKRRTFTMGFTYFFVGLGYTLAAVCKLVGTGLFWSDGRHLWIWIHEKAVDAFAYTGILDYNLLQVWSLNSVSFATLILTFGLLAEMFSWLMWWRKYRTPILLAVIGLHVGIYLVMNIMFWETFYELILLAFPWAVWLDKALARTSTPAANNPLVRLGYQYA